MKRELIESKQSFDMIWADNASIQKLTGMIFESDEAIVGALSEALQDIPYLALASKKSLFNTFSNCLTHADGIGVSDKDIQGFASRIFEYKKDIKKSFIENINEKYGVNIQNLQSPASFKSLANTQVVIFEALSRLSHKGSVLKEVLSEMAQGLKTKSGVECIDVNEYLLEMFVSVGYDEILDEAATATKEKVDFKRVGKSSKRGVKDEEYPSDETLDDKKLAASEADETSDKDTKSEAAPPPPEDPAEADDAEEEEKVRSVGTQKDLVSDIGDLEDLIANMASELADDDDEKEDN